MAVQQSVQQSVQQRARRLFRVYIDEAGDRGWDSNSSPVFVLAAVIVPDEEDRLARSILDEINVQLGRAPQSLLHWSKNLKEHSPRKLVARTIGASDVALTAVIVHKSCLVNAGSALGDPAKQYNYAVRRLLERVTWYVDRRDGEAILTFAHVRRFPYDELEDYLRHLRNSATEIKWRALRRVRINQPKKIRLLQMADLVAGCIYAAVRTDKFGDYEPAYLREIAPRLWTGPTGKLHTYGLHFVGAGGCACAQTYPWWTELVEKCLAA
ncbi:MAG: DUF3800 domain-containing protein [Actinomycetota bacterium]|nr:DUF3800 domain-containing protein [Actinomycetota bacterium]